MSKSNPERHAKQCSPSLRARKCAVLAAAAFSAIAGYANAQTATWTFNGGGSWGVGANWLGGTPAQGASNGALFNALNLTSDYTVTLDSDQLVGTIAFNDTFKSH